MSTSNRVPAVRAPEPAADMSPDSVDPAVDAVPDEVEPAADLVPGPDTDPIPPEAGVEPPAADEGLTPKPSSDVIVLEKRHLRQSAGALIGALIGLMLVGAIVVPFFGDDLLVLGIAAGIATVLALAALGMRMAAGSAHDPN